MTAPSRPTTYAEALIAAKAIRAAAKVPSDPITVTQRVSGQIIDQRDRSAKYAKTAIRALWDAVDPYNDDQVQRFAQQAAKIMGAAQTAAGRIAAAGQSQQLASMGIKVSAVPSNPLNVRGQATIRRGKITVRQKTSTIDYISGNNAKVSNADMTTEAAFQRPAKAYRYAQSQGRDGNTHALDRIDSLVDSNLMLSQRLAQQEVLAKAVDLDKPGPKITGYRRVIHPEMSKGGTCGMCIAASTRIYRVSELLPIHDHCACTVAAVTEDHDPADEMNARDLADLYGKAGGNTVAHLKRTRYQVDEHGELGPVLVPKKAYRGKGYRKSRAKKSLGDLAKRNIGPLQERLDKLRAEGANEKSAKVQYLKRTISRLQLEVDAANTSRHR